MTESASSSARRSASGSTWLAIVEEVWLSGSDVAVEGREAEGSLGESTVGVEAGEDVDAIMADREGDIVI